MYILNYRNSKERLGQSHHETKANHMLIRTGVSSRIFTYWNISRFSFTTGTLSKEHWCQTHRVRIATMLLNLSVCGHHCVGKPLRRDVNKAFMDERVSSPDGWAGGPAVRTDGPGPVDYDFVHPVLWWVVGSSVVVGLTRLSHEERTYMVWHSCFINDMWLRTHGFVIK